MMRDSRPPAVLFLLSSLGTGGSELKTVRLANALASRGIPSMLAYLSPPFALTSEAAPEVELVHLHRRGKVSLRALRLLSRILRDRDIHTIVAVNLYPALYVWLARLAARGRRPRFVATVNTTDIRSRKLALQMHLYRRILSAADLVIFGAEAQRRLWCEKYGVRNYVHRTRVIYNGVDTERFVPAAAAPHRAGDGSVSPFIIGTVGQMRPEKSHVDLVRAVAMLRARGFDVRAVLVGDGPERPRIAAEIAQLGMSDSISFAGEARDVRPFLASMDVFVLTSTAVETFSNAALEALSSGVPVVASDIGGIRELLAFGGGITYPPGDAASLSEHLALLLRDRERRMRMSTEARSAVEEHFSFHRMVEEFVNVLGPHAQGDATAPARTAGDPVARASASMFGSAREFEPRGPA